MPSPEANDITLLRQLALRSDDSVESSDLVSGLDNNASDLLPVLLAYPMSGRATVICSAAWTTLKSNPTTTTLVQRFPSADPINSLPTTEQPKRWFGAEA